MAPLTDPSTDGPADDPEAAPLADLAERVGRRRGRAETDDFDTLFEEQPVDAVDGESLWDDPVASAESEFGAVGEVVEAGERTHVVSTRNFCEQCPYFSTPPRANCTHEGTEIREFVDKDHVRVHDCPVVEERGLSGERPPD